MKLFKMEELSLQDCTHIVGASYEGGESGGGGGGGHNEEGNPWPGGGGGTPEE